MPTTTDQLVRIAAAGGGFTIDASKRKVDDLVRISAAASKQLARIQLKNCDRMGTEDLVRIAAAGKGCVSFDFSA